MVHTLPVRFAQACELINTWTAPLWLDFVPSRVPLVLFGGEATFLVGAEPTEPGWERCEHGWRWPGQHPAVISNTCTEVEPGLWAASVLHSTLAGADARTLASLFVHEAFHVWQRAHPSPAWDANELAALSYPETAHVLHTRAEEAFWLAQALAPSSRAAVGHVLFWRARRFAALSEEHRQLEGRMETLEGLAQHVEQRFLGEQPRMSPDLSLCCSTRAWSYHSGAALAHLLTGDGWQERVMQGEFLDALISSQYSSVPAEAHPELQAAAVRRVAELQGDKDRRLAEFYALGGGHLRLTCPGGLTVQGFDPMNVVCLGPELWLHRRYLHLASASGRIEVRQGQVLARGPSLFMVTALELPGLPLPAPHAERWQVETGTHSIDVPASAVQEARPGGN